jgi:HEAT repeat protein
MQPSCLSAQDGVYSIMRKRWRLTLGLALAVALTAFVWHGIRSQWLPSEPMYQGRPLSSWLPKVLFENPGGVQNSPDHYRDALAAVGPPAVPFILAKLRKSDSALANRYRDLWPRFPAVLQRVLPKPSPPDYSTWSAAAALICLGTNAIPALVDAMDDGNPAVREAVGQALCGLAGGALSTKDTARLFGQAIKDSDAEVRVYAAFALARIGPAASNSVPALIRALNSPQNGRTPGTIFFVHAGAASALAAIGRPATQAIPVLTRLLPAADHDTQCIFTNALNALEMQTAGANKIE